METHDPSRNIRALASAGLEPALSTDIDETHALVQRLIGPQVASTDVIRSVHAHCETSIFVYRENGRIAAVLAELPLVASGVRALLDGRFDGSNPRLDHIARRGDLLAAHYCWGLAAEGRRAAAASIRGLVIARNDIYGALPFFARASDDPSTDGHSDGVRVGLRRLGCTFYPGRPTLLYAPAPHQSGRTAA